MNEETKKTKSVRLNKYLREQILDSVLEEYVTNFLKPYGYTSTEEVASLICEESRNVADLWWEKCYSGINFEALPEWCLNGHRQIIVQVENDTGKMFVNNCNKDKVRPTSGSVDLLVSQEEWDVVRKDLVHMRKLKQEVVEGRKALRKQIYPVLLSFGSTKQLIETWPSMEKFLPANIADPDKGVNLPALNLSRLDAVIAGGSS